MNNQYFTQEELNFVTKVAIKATREKAFQVLSYVLTAYVDKDLYEAIRKDFEEELTEACIYREKNI